MFLSKQIFQSCFNVLICQHKPISIMIYITIKKKKVFRVLTLFQSNWTSAEGNSILSKVLLTRFYGQQCLCTKLGTFMSLYTPANRKKSMWISHMQSLHEAFQALIKSIVSDVLNIHFTLSRGSKLIVIAQES